MLTLVVMLRACMGLLEPIALNPDKIEQNKVLPLDGESNMSKRTY